MKRIKTKLMLGTGVIFILSYLILVVNMGANQSVMNKSKSLLVDNYPSVKHSFDMLKILNELNNLLHVNTYQQNFNDTTGTLSFQINSLLNEFEENLGVQLTNITEAGEDELTQSLQGAYLELKGFLSTFTRKGRFDRATYRVIYNNLKGDILSIYNLNIKVLENKNREIREKSMRIIKIQKDIGIIGLALLAIMIIILPSFIINPINRLAERLKKFYKENFNTEIKVENDNELAVLEELFEQIAVEFSKTEKSRTDQ